MAETITIYKRQYALPVLATERFAHVQRRIRERQQMIQQGKRAQQIKEEYHETLPPAPTPPGLLNRWLGRKTPAPPRTVTKTRTKTAWQELSAEDRFTVMEELMGEYETMLGLLDTHKVQYDRLLAQIGDGIREFAAERCQKYLQTDANLTAIEQDALADHDESDLRSIGADRARLIQTIRLLSQAMLLITKKIDLFRAGLNKIAEDQELKRSLVDKKRRKLNRQYKMDLVKKDIAKFQEEVSEILKVALNFEELMRECFGPLQALLEEVTGMDGAFAGAAEEIDNLTRMIMNDDTGNTAIAALNDAEEDLLNFLLHSQLQREQLTDVVNQAWQADAEACFDAELAQSKAVSVRQALENLRTFLDLRLPQPIDINERNFRSLPDFGSFIDLDNGVTLELCAIPGGTFWMGQTDEEQRLLKQWQWWDDYFNCERPRHQVTIPPFYLGKYPVTQAQWEAVMGNNPSHFKGADRPVENVSWDEAQTFIEKLNATHPYPSQEGSSGIPLLGGVGGGFLFRLPTEAEWEYACRAGTETVWHFGNDPAQLGEYAWHSANSGSETHPVGQKPPNAFGLHDMLGNVWEWCQDVWHDNYQGAPGDGSAWEQGGNASYRLLRGGSWYAPPVSVRSADRSHYSPAYPYNDIGLRLVVVGARTL